MSLGCLGGLVGLIGAVLGWSRAICADKGGISKYAFSCFSNVFSLRATIAGACSFFPHRLYTRILARPQQSRTPHGYRWVFMHKLVAAWLGRVRFSGHGRRLSGHGPLR